MGSSGRGAHAIEKLPTGIHERRASDLAAAPQNRLLR